MLASGDSVLISRHQERGPELINVTHEDFPLRWFRVTPEVIVITGDQLYRV